MAESAQRRTLVMTGATSGIGEEALPRLARPGTRILIGARSTSTPPRVDQVEVLPLDLGSLQGVRAFASEVLDRLDGDRIDALVLNAGATFSDTSIRTSDGFERTFAINHLAHHLLARLLLPVMSDAGRIVITTSDTHDPAQFTGAPTRLDVQAWATGPESTMHAYTASKLANLLTAQKLATLAEVRARGISVVAYNPGLTGGTGLMSSVPPAARVAMRAMRPVLAAVSLVRPIMYMGTVEHAGAALADLVDGVAVPPDHRIYASMVRGRLEYPDPSELAQDADARDELWHASADMVGLPAT